MGYKEAVIGLLALAGAVGIALYAIFVGKR